MQAFTTLRCVLVGILVVNCANGNHQPWDTMHFLNKLQLSHVPHLHARPSNVPEYTDHLYRMFASIPKDEMRGLGKEGLTSHALIPQDWTALENQMNFRFAKADVIKESVAHAEIILSLAKGGGCSYEDALNVRVCERLDGCSRHERVGGLVMRPFGHSFLLYNITNLFDQWLKKAERLQETHSFNITLSNDNIDTHLRPCLADDAQPLLVLHREDNTWRYETHMQEVIEKKEENLLRRRRRVRRLAVVEQELCKRHDWRVSFQDMGWDTWVIQPTGFQAGLCGGVCDAEDSKISGHAYLRLMYKDKVHTPEASRIPGPFCGATKMAPMSLLFQDGEGTITVKTIPDMLIDECACI